MQHNTKDDHDRVDDNEWSHGHSNGNIFHEMGSIDSRKSSNGLAILPEKCSIDKHCILN